MCSSRCPYEFSHLSFSLPSRFISYSLAGSRRDIAQKYFPRMCVCMCWAIFFTWRDKCTFLGIGATTGERAELQQNIPSVCRDMYNLLTLSTRNTKDQPLSNNGMQAFRFFICIYNVNVLFWLWGETRHSPKKTSFALLCEHCVHEQCIHNATLSKNQWVTLLFSFLLTYFFHNTQLR